MTKIIQLLKLYLTAMLPYNCYINIIDYTFDCYILTIL